MSTVWLIRPASWPPALASPSDIALIEVEIDDADLLVALLADREIVITSGVPLKAALLARCRRIRGIIDAGNPSQDIVDFTFARRAGLQTEQVNYTELNAAAVEQVLPLQRRMEQHLRVLDDIADHWEGT